jgi:hypothetical protein
MTEDGGVDKTWRKYRILLGVGVIFFVCVLFFAIQTDVLSKRNAPPLSLATSLAACESARGDGAVVACARSVIDKLLKTQTAREAMTGISSRRLPPVFQGCHSVGHLIGAQTFKKSNDLEQTLSECSDDCSSACIHGALGAAVEKDLGEKYPDEDIAHASLEEIKNIGTKYCTNSGLCHGMGHILLINTNDLVKAAQGCNAISSGFMSEMCEQGVFMQGVGTFRSALILSDDTLAPAKNTSVVDYAFPCNSVPSQFRHACFQYLPAYANLVFEKEGVTDPNVKAERFAQTCTTFQDHDRTWCFEALGKETIFDRIFTTSIDEMLTRCSRLEKEDDRKSCVIGRIYTFTQFDIGDEALQYCGAVDAALQTICSNALFQFETAKSLTQSLDPKVFCLQSGTPALCEEAFKKYSAVSATLPNYRFGLFGEVR